MVSLDDYQDGHVYRDGPTWGVCIAEWANYEDWITAQIMSNLIDLWRADMEARK